MSKLFVDNSEKAQTATQEIYNYFPDKISFFGIFKIFNNKQIYNIFLIKKKRFFFKKFKS